MATTIADEQARAVAEKFARLVAERDLDGLRELYTPDARIWHNSDDTEKSVDESLQFFGGFLTITNKVWYSDIRVTPTPSGYLDQHYLCANLTTGADVRLPMCMVVTLEGERVKRLEEYIVTNADAIDEALAAHG